MIMTLRNNSHVGVGALFEFAKMKVELDDASKSHLEDCAVCMDRLSWMQASADLGPQEMEFEPPQAALDSVLRLARRPDYLKQFGNYILASLTFDSLSSPATAGVRRSEGGSREMTYEAADIEVAISIRPSGSRKITLTGQVSQKNASPIADPSAHVDLVQDGDHIASSPLSDWGEFIFPDLSDAAYSLQIQLADRVVRISSLPSQGS
ncbi:MAG TPA: hypothetical protein VGK48_12620 [Terriglobia bacterium]|jgi:hypothetical protein